MIVGVVIVAIFAAGIVLLNSTGAMSEPDGHDGVHDPSIHSFKFPPDVIQKLREEHGDRFAGAYLESDTYHINLIEGADPLTLGIDLDAFTVHEVAFSYDELTMLYEEVLALDAEEKIRFGVQTIRLDERENRVIIALRPDHGHMMAEVSALFDHPAIEVVISEGTIQLTE